MYSLNNNCVFLIYFSFICEKNLFNLKNCYICIRKKHENYENKTTFFSIVILALY